jgi:ribosomal protein L37E
MGRHHASDDYEDDPDELDESDMDGDEGNEFVETIACPHCGKAVYEQAERCSACGRYLSEEDSPRTGHPRWVIATTLLLLAVILYGWVKWSF